MTGQPDPAAPGADLAERLAALEGQIAEACEAAGRSRAEVQLIAVSKTHPAEAVRAAYALGLRRFGENYAQEMAKKAEILGDSCPDLEWHFIGRVQSNKAKLLADAALVHGVGSVSHAAALGRRAREGRPVKLLAQVNVSGEEQKNGFSPGDLRNELEALARVPGTSLAGLMTMLEKGERGEAARACFRALRELRDALQGSSGLALPILSMGMSADFREAILEGATHIRVGTALFGPRPRPLGNP